MYRPRPEDGADLETCAEMLSAVGFRYSAKLGYWVHRAHARVISHETVAAHDTDWLAHWITSG